MSLYDIEKIRSSLIDEIKNMQIIITESIPSTNDYAKDILSDKNDKEPLLILAREQTAGKGQYGRKFYSPMDKGIYMSLAICPDIGGEDLPYITLLCGVCVRKAIYDVCGLSCDLKYVNDVLFGAKKLCGILTESVFEGNELKAVIIGIGINAVHSEYPQDIRDLVTCINDHLTSDADINRLIAATVNNIYEGINNYNTDAIKSLYLHFAVDLPPGNLVE